MTENWLDRINEMKLAQYSAMLNTLTPLVREHVGRHDLRGGPNELLPLGETHTRDWPEFVLTLMLRGCLDPETAPKAMEEAWISPEYPEENGGRRNWRNAWKQLGYTVDGEYAERPTEPLVLYAGLEGPLANDPKHWGQMAWTATESVARWFASRFQKEEQLVLRAEVDPKRLYAHFTSRNEDEYVIDTRGLKPEVHWRKE